MKQDVAEDCTELGTSRHFSRFRAFVFTSLLSDSVPGAELLRLNSCEEKKRKKNKQQPCREEDIERMLESSKSSSRPALKAQ